MKSKEAMTWRELKEQVNAFNDDQLDRKVWLCGDDRSFPVQSFWVLEEDYFTDDEGMNPVSIFSEEEWESPLSEFDITPKGTPFLSTDEWEDDK